MSDKNDLLEQLERINDVFFYVVVAVFALGLFGSPLIVDYHSDAYAIIVVCSIAVALSGMGMASFAKYLKVNNFLIDHVRLSERACMVNTASQTNQPTYGIRLDHPTQYYLVYTVDDPKGACERAKKLAKQKLKDVNVDTDKWLVFFKPSPRIPPNIYIRVSKKEYDACLPGQRNEIGIYPYNF